jgi:hypothetical protein
MVAINTHPITKVMPLQGDFEEAAEADTVAEEAEALALTLTDATNPHDWTYSATAEDNTTDIHSPGEDTPPEEMDDQPGLIYSGPSGVSVRVSVANLDVSEGTIAPEAGDSVEAVVYLNSTPMIKSDEGVVAEHDLETATEFNIDGVIPNVQESDVIRVGVRGAGEETVTWDIAEGGEFTVR